MVPVCSNVNLRRSTSLDVSVALAASGSQPLGISAAETPRRVRKSSTIGWVTPTTALGPRRYPTLEPALERALRDGRKRIAQGLEQPAVAKVSDPGRVAPAQREAEQVSRIGRPAGDHAVDVAIAQQARDARRAHGFHPSR